ncbi:MAG: hypothetical protein RIB01_15440 [Balneola sp.]
MKILFSPRQINLLNELNRKYLVCDLDTDQLAIEELKEICTWHEPTLDFEQARAELLDRRAQYRKDYPVFIIQLKGELKSGRVWLFDQELFPFRSREFRNLSPSGFSWGYGGSGPAQLALAICVELFGEDLAMSIYQSFKFRYIATLPQTDFECDLVVNLNELKSKKFK